jgi:hypothetical protein
MVPVQARASLVKDTGSTPRYTGHSAERAVYRPGIILACFFACAPSVARAQSVSLTGGNATGDCGGTSFHQMAEASGRYLAAEWAVPGQFPIGINRGRVRCTIRFNVTVQTGYRLIAGGSGGVAERLAVAQLSTLRLNGATTGVLAESAISIDNGTPATAAAVSNGGPTTAAALLQDRAPGSQSAQSVCSTAATSTFQISAVLELAAASSYVIPWPPEPIAERETATMGGYRLFYTVVPCTTRSVAPPSELIKP